MEAEVHVKARCWPCVQRIFVAATDSLDLPMVSESDLRMYCLRERLEVKSKAHGGNFTTPLHADVDLQGADRVKSVRVVSTTTPFTDKYGGAPAFRPKGAFPNFTWFEAYRA